MPRRRIQPGAASATNPIPNSLDHDDCLTLQRVVEGLAPDWSADIHQDPVGEVCMMIMPPEVQDEIGPLLVAHKLSSVFRLDKFHWDVYSTIGEFRTFDELVDAVRRTLLALPAVSPKPVLLH